MIRFRIRGEFIELVKLLKAAGVCESGGAAGQAVEAGLVLVDGNRESRKRFKVRPGRTVTLGDEQIRVEGESESPAQDEAGPSVS